MYGKEDTIRIMTNLNISLVCCGSRAKSNTIRKSLQSQSHTPWASVLTPPLLFEDAPSRDDDAAKLANISESVHPVRR